MNRRFISFAYFSCLVGFSTFVREVASVIITVARYVIDAVATPVAVIWARLALPKVSNFKVVGCLKRMYRESWLTSGQSLHQRRWIYC